MHTSRCWLGIQQTCRGPAASTSQAITAPALLRPSAGCIESLWTKPLVARVVIAIHVQNEFAFAIPAELIFKCMEETHRIASLRLHCAYEVAEATQLPEKCFVASSSHVCSCGYTTPSWFEGDDLDKLYERCAPLYELLQQATLAIRRAGGTDRRNIYWCTFQRI